MGSNTEKKPWTNLQNKDDIKKLPFLKGKKIISNFYGSNIIFAYCIIKTIILDFNSFWAFGYYHVSVLMKYIRYKTIIYDDSFELFEKLLKTKRFF